MNRRLIQLFAPGCFLLLGACGATRFTATDATDVHPPRPAASVAVFTSDPADVAYREAGVIEVDAATFADARELFQRAGGDHGCHAVRAWGTRTAVYGGQAAPNVNVTTFIGTCLVPETL